MFPTDSVITKFLGVDGIINVLTIVPIAEIATKRIAYVRSKMEETEATTPIWDIFWSYFKKSYLKGPWGPENWSIHRFLKSEDANFVFINRYSHTTVCLQLPFHNIEVYSYPCYEIRSSLESMECLMSQ